MSTPISDMVAAMLAASVQHDMIVLAVATAERSAAAASTISTTVSTETVDTRQEKRRISERLKKRKWRSKRKNSPPASADRPADVSTLPVVDTVDMSTSPSLSVSSLNKERTSEREARARAKPCPPVDIPADWQPSPEDERFAGDRRGFSPAEIADVAFKFKTHFSATGERRPDWSKAWLKWVLDERRPLYAIPGGKADARKADPLRKARQFTDAEWRRKCTLVATDPSVAWPEEEWGPALGKPGCLITETVQRELSNYPTRNQGANQCMAQ